MSASGVTITKVSACKMRVAFVVQTTVALLHLLSPAQVGTRKVAHRECRGAVFFMKSLLCPPLLLGNP